MRGRLLGVLAGAVLLMACSTQSSHDARATKPAATRDAGSSGPSTSRATPQVPTRSSTAHTQRRRPNIVLLMTDDESLTDMWVMPKTRHLIGDAGATFGRAFSNYPLCCPARATVLTGQYAHNHGVMGNEAPWGGYTRYVNERDSLPVWLHRAGYRTAMLGKYLTGYPLSGHTSYVPPGWDEWHVPVHGTYNYEYRTVNDNGRLHKYHQYQSGYLADEADRVIRAQDPRQPLFMWASFLAPHEGDPYEAGDPPAKGPQHLSTTPAVEGRYRDTMKSVDLPDNESLNEQDMSDKGSFMRRLPKLNLSYAREGYQQRLESLRSVDDAVEKIVSTLRARGMLDNTLVMFVSDNGFLVGQHRWYQKVLGYEEAIRVPLLIRGPGIKAGSEVAQQVSLADLSATAVAAAHAKPGHDLDGTPLLPLVRDPRLLADRAMLMEAGGWPFRTQKRLYNGVRTADNHVLLRWYDGHQEVYDLARDPEELDGTTSAAEQARIPALEEALRVLATCAGASCNAVTGR